MDSDFEEPLKWIFALVFYIPIFYTMTRIISKGGPDSTVEILRLITLPWWLSVVGSSVVAWFVLVWFMRWVGILN